MMQRRGRFILAAAVAVLEIQQLQHCQAVSYTATILYPLSTPTGFITSDTTVTTIDAIGAIGVADGSEGLLWNAPGGAVTRVSGIAPYAGGEFFGSDGPNQVGYSEFSGSAYQAALWSGKNTPAVNLEPTNLSGIADSEAVGVSGSQQVGYADTYSTTHAYLWSGTAASAVDITPTNLPGITNAAALGTDGLQQVGDGTYGNPSAGIRHALLWSGTAASAVDLQPATPPYGLTSTQAIAISGNQQVGFGTNTGSAALLWEGTAASLVYLEPSLPDIINSHAQGTNGTQQVGYGYYDNPGVASLYDGNHAIVWTGSSSSAVDLENALPTSATEFWYTSQAFTIDSSGNIFGAAMGSPSADVTGLYAVEWSPSGVSSGVNVASGNRYHFTVNTGTGILQQTIEGLTINATASAIVDPAAVSANRQLLTVLGSGLTIAGATGDFLGWLDLGNNDLDLPGASLSNIVSQIQQGYAGGRWNGSGGIISSSAAADSRHLTALGVIQNNQGGSPVFTSTHTFDGTVPGPLDILVKYTYYGDANLDGKVDGSDYSRIDAAYLADTTRSATATGWYNGDFNYDGAVDGSDYTLIDNAFNSQGAGITAAMSSPDALSTDQIADQITGATNVPELTTDGALGILLVCFLSRRRASPGIFPAMMPETARKSAGA